MDKQAVGLLAGARWAQAGAAVERRLARMTVGTASREAWVRWRAERSFRALARKLARKAQRRASAKGGVA